MNLECTDESIQSGSTKPLSTCREMSARRLTSSEVLSELCAMLTAVQDLRSSCDDS